MIIQNIQEHAIGFDMTYHDDPIFEDYRVVREPHYNIYRTTPQYNINRGTGEYNVQRANMYNIIGEPQY